MPKVSHPQGVRWVDSDEVEQEAEALEVLSYVCDGRVSGVKPEFRGKLGLRRGEEGGGQGGGT
jgi:hypothetical protein